MSFAIALQFHYLGAKQNGTLSLGDLRSAESHSQRGCALLWAVSRTAAYFVLRNWRNSNAMFTPTLLHFSPRLLANTATANYAGWPQLCK